MAVGRIPTERPTAGRDCSAPQGGGNWCPGEVPPDHDIRYCGQVLPPDFGTTNAGEPSVQFLPEGVQTVGWFSGLGMVYPRGHPSTSG